MRDINKLDKFYDELKEIHKEYFSNCCFDLFIDKVEAIRNYANKESNPNFVSAADIAKIKARISSVITYCILNSGVKVMTPVHNRRALTNALYMTKDALSLFKNVQGCDYKFLTKNTYFCIKFKNGSTFEVKYYQPKGRGKRADMNIIDEHIPEKDKMILLDCCDVIEGSSI